jgi:arginyl-tRNA synthetase
MVDLPSGKMKSREGTVVDADELMDDMIQTAQERTEELGKVDGFTEEEKKDLYNMIGLGALKFFLLKVEPKKRLLFDPNESIDFQGHTGPFIQYTHARICSVLAKADYKNKISDNYSNVLTILEKDLIVNLAKYPDVISSAAREYSPAHIANYVFELAKLFNKFYHEESILKAEDSQVRNFRLDLAAATAATINKAMKLLGISVPSRM